MKLTFCLLALLLAFASCETSFRISEIPSELPGNLSEDPHKVLAEFLTGLFAHFGLDQPKQIIYECVDKKSAALFLESMFTFYQALVDAVARDSFHYDLDMAKQYALYLLEHPAIDCITATQDFSDLVAALGVERDPVWVNTASTLYFQAHYAQILDAYGPIMEGLKTGNFFAAGDAYAALQKKTVDDTKQEGIADLAHIGLNNGFAVGLDVDLPSDSLAVWDNTTAGYDLELITGVAKAVADGESWESYDNLMKFWEEKGAEIFNKIPASVWEDLAGSEDNKKVTEKLGVDVMSRQFGDLTLKWVKEHPFEYHAHAKNLLKSFEELNVGNVGVLHAQLTKEIARSK